MRQLPTKGYGQSWSTAECYDIIRAHRTAKEKLELQAQKKKQAALSALRDRHRTNYELAKTKLSGVTRETCKILTVNEWKAVLVFEVPSYRLNVKHADLAQQYFAHQEKQLMEAIRECNEDEGLQIVSSCAVERIDSVDGGDGDEHEDDGDLAAAFDQMDETEEENLNGDENIEDIV